MAIALRILPGDRTLEVVSGTPILRATPLIREGPTETGTPPWLTKTHTRRTHPHAPRVGK
jgi:hypothetical protein